jgi:hypothetical protein
MQLKLRSTITPEIKRKTLFRGTAIAVIGLLTLGFAYFYISEATLREWGWAFYLWGLLFIVWGLLPYRQLMRIEDFPFVLWSLDSHDLQILAFGKNQRAFWKIFVSEITSVSYRDDPTYYGIVIMSGEKKHFCPYFSKRSFEELKSFIGDPPG